jgi:hypothetical protein
MSSRLVSLVRIAALSAVTSASASGPLLAQESRSAGQVKELVDRLGQAKLEAVAARGAEADQFVAALYIPGFQLRVVSARYAAPAIMADKLTKRQYRDAYVDLNSASDPASRMFIEDMAADGLKLRSGRNELSDSYELSAKRVTFDGDHGEQKITEDEYTKAFAAAEQAYGAILSTLLAELKKGS